MIKPIIQKIYDEMITGVGPNSSYTDNKIENVYINLPATVSGNRFLAVEYGNKSAGDYEIGQGLAFTYTYDISIIIGVKHPDKLSALELLDTLEKRVLKQLSASNVTSVEDTLDQITERVLTLKLSGAGYEDLFKESDLAYGIRLNLQVQTQLQV